MKRQTKHLEYAMAATASGVGVMCLAQPAEARIVYTPVNVNVPVNTVLPIDLNHDGIADFKLVNFYAYGSGIPGGGLVVDLKRRANEVWLGDLHRHHLRQSPVGRRLAQGHEGGPKRTVCAGLSVG